MNNFHVAEYISNVPQLSIFMEAADYQSLIDSINTKTIPMRNDTLQTINAIILEFGLIDSQAIIESLEAVASTNGLLKAIYTKLCSTGINFADVHTQGMIDTLTTAGLWAPEIGVRLKELGIWAISEAKSRFEQDLVIEDMPAIAIEYNKIKLRAECATRTNAVLAAIDLEQATTVDDLKTVFSA